MLRSGRAAGIQEVGGWVGLRMLRRSQGSFQHVGCAAWSETPVLMHNGWVSHLMGRGSALQCPCWGVRLLWQGPGMLAAH
jgi:hypothetical protein